MSGPKVALITGASRGIGRSIADKLAASGILVAVHYGSNREAADVAVAAIRDRGGDAFPLEARLDTTAEIESLFTKFDKALESRGLEAKFDILVNNAGVSEAATIEQTSEALFDRTFDINVKAPYFMTQHALPRLRDDGRIINISSVVSLRIIPHYSVYSLSKAALNNLTRMLAKQLASRRITVNTVAPGPTRTDMMEELLKDPRVHAAVMGQVPMGRLGETDDISDVVAFVVSDQARWMTGQLIDVSGGTGLNG